MRWLLFYVILLLYSYKTVQSVPTSTQSPRLVEEKLTSYATNKSNNEKLLDDLVNHQTENVKIIVAEETPYNGPEYPVLTKLDPQYSEEAKKERETLSLEELKVKCQHISKLLNVNKTSDNKKPTNHTNRYSNHKPTDVYKRPVYIHSKPSNRYEYPTTSKPHGFYITQTTPTKKPQGTPIRYIHLEPVILQKTILSDGRTVYYWHKSLPTAVEFANNPQQHNYVSNRNDVYETVPKVNFAQNGYGGYIYGNTENSYIYGNTPNGYIPLPQNAYISPSNAYLSMYKNLYGDTTKNNLENKNSTGDITETSTTTTTEETGYNGYGFGSFLPFYSYRQDPTTTTESTTTSTTPIQEQITEAIKPDDLHYAQQLRFIIPVPYDNLYGDVNMPTKQPWDVDQYAYYYPKEQLQPKTVNVQVPYTSTFHMIRAVAVPGSEGNSNNNVEYIKF